MRILSHRGYWHELDERNTDVAFQRTVDCNFGTETDLRDDGGIVVIAHDMTEGNHMPFVDFLDYFKNNKDLYLALNIKADGLIESVLADLAKHDYQNYFTFDMSVPDMIFQAKFHDKFFTGLSDVLTVAPWLDKADGVWLDSMYSEWWSTSDLDGILDQGKKVCIVSSDLHKRPFEEQWEKIRKSKHFNSDDLMLCSDIPETAQKYFK